MSTFDAAQIAAEAEAEGRDPVSAVIFQALGFASKCWEDMSGTGVFQDGEAKAAGDSVVEWLRSPAAVVGSEAAAWDVGMKAGRSYEGDMWKWQAGGISRSVNGLTERPSVPTNPYL